LPDEKAHLKAADNDEKKRKKSRSVFRQPWLLVLGFFGGWLGGLSCGWLMARSRKRV
jgi:F0F1-type ATP synthase assembly protein I